MGSSERSKVIEWTFAYLKKDVELSVASIHRMVSIFDRYLGLRPHEPIIESFFAALWLITTYENVPSLETPDFTIEKLWGGLVNSGDTSVSLQPNHRDEPVVLRPSWISTSVHNRARDILRILECTLTTPTSYDHMAWILRTGSKEERERGEELLRDVLTHHSSLEHPAYVLASSCATVASQHGDYNTWKRCYHHTGNEVVPKPPPRARPRFVLESSAFAKGAYGSLFKARRVYSRVELACKRQKLNTQTLREAAILKHLPPHPNLVTLVDVVINMKCVDLFFPLADKDLWSWIGTADWSEDSVPRLGHELFSAIDHCHSHGVLHRDIKSTNVLVSAAGTLQLTDFGLSREYQTPNRMYTCNVVSLWWRPPELLSSTETHMRYGTEVDMWSAGVVLITMITGKTPWKGGDADEMLDLIQCSNEWVNKCGRNALDLVTRLVDIDPRRRGSASEASRHAYLASSPTFHAS